MAFEKRTWLARIGAGLNKFIIGEKDAGGKQTLTNSPDSVTQIGDVISAENLNDLEERIEAGLNDLETQTQTALAGKVNTTDLNDTLTGMKLTKVWENPNLSAEFSAQTVSFAGGEEIIIVHSLMGGSLRGYCHIKCESGASISLAGGGRLSKVTVNSTSFNVWGRSFGMAVNGGSTQLSFGDAYVLSIDNFTTSPQRHIITNNTVLVPLEIYSVGDIYNS